MKEKTAGADSPMEAAEENALEVAEALIGAPVTGSVRRSGESDADAERGTTAGNGR